MAGKRPTTIAEYISPAPGGAKPHLRGLYAILKSVAPDAEEAMECGNPFFVDPRFLFAVAAHKAHLSFAPSPAALDAFRKELEDHDTTKNFLKIPYSKPLPQKLIRKIATYRVKNISDSDGFCA